MNAPLNRSGEYCHFVCCSSGVSRGSLQLAWDFSTASEQCITDRLLHMRDDAMKRIGDKGEYHVVRAQDNYSKDIFR